MPDFDQRLADLATAAGQSATFRAPSAIRSRAGRMLRRRVVAMAAVAIAVGTVTIIAAQAFPSSHGPIVATSPSPLASPSPWASPTPPEEPPITPTGLVNCSIGDISYGWGKRDTAGTHRGAPLVLTNTRDYACRLTGYLTINAVAPIGPFVPAAPTKSGYLGGVRGALPVIVLAPNQSASAYVEALAIDPSTGNSCGAFREFDVTLPGDGAGITVPQWTKDACAALQVHPLVAGKTGRH